MADFNDRLIKLTRLLDSDGRLPGSGNTTYTIEFNPTTRVLTLVGSDGTRDSDTIPDSDTTYSLGGSGATVRLTGSDGTVTTYTVSGLTPGHHDSEAIIKSTDTWVSADSDLATTAAIDRRIHDLNELKHFNLVIQRNYATNENWQIGEQVYVSGIPYHPTHLVAYQPTLTQYVSNNRIRFVFDDVTQLNAYRAEWLVVGRRFARGTNRQAEQYIQQVFSYNNETIEDTFPIPSYRGLPFLDVQLTTTVNTAWQGIGGGISFVYFYDDTDESHGVFEYVGPTDNNNAMTTDANWTLIHDYDDASLRKLIAENTSRINANTTQIEANRDNITINRNRIDSEATRLTTEIANREGADITAASFDTDSRVLTLTRADGNLTATIPAAPAGADTTYEIITHRPTLPNVDSGTSDLYLRSSTGDSELIFRSTVQITRHDLNGGLYIATGGVQPTNLHNGNASFLGNGTAGQFLAPFNNAQGTTTGFQWMTPPGGGTNVTQQLLTVERDSDTLDFVENDSEGFYVMIINGINVDSDNFSISGPVITYPRGFVTGDEVTLRHFATASGGGGGGTDTNTTYRITQDSELVYLRSSTGDTELIVQGSASIDISSNKQLTIAAAGVSRTQLDSNGAALAQGNTGQFLTRDTSGNGFAWANVSDTDTTYTFSQYEDQLSIRDNVTGTVFHYRPLGIDSDSESGVMMLDSDGNTSGTLLYVKDTESGIVYLQSDHYAPAHSGIAATNARDVLLDRGNSLSNNRVWGPTATGRPLLEPQDGSTPTVASWYLEMNTDFTDAYLNILRSEGGPFSMILSSATLHARMQAAIANVQLWHGQAANATWANRVFVVIPDSQVTWNPNGITNGSPTTVGGSFSGAPADNSTFADGSTGVAFYRVVFGHAAIPATPQVGLRIPVTKNDYDFVSTNDFIAGANIVIADSDGRVRISSTASGGSVDTDNFIAGNNITLADTDGRVRIDAANPEVSDFVAGPNVSITADSGRVRIAAVIPGGGATPGTGITVTTADSEDYWNVSGARFYDFGDGDSDGAAANAGTNAGAIAIGKASSALYNNSVAIGNGATATEANQAVIGGSGVTHVRAGNANYVPTDSEDFVTKSYVDTQGANIPTISSQNAQLFSKFIADRNNTNYPVTLLGYMLTDSDYYTEWRWDTATSSLLPSAGQYQTFTVSNSTTTQTGRQDSIGNTVPTGTFTCHMIYNNNVYRNITATISDVGFHHGIGLSIPNTAGEAVTGFTSTSFYLFRQL